MNTDITFQGGTKVLITKELSFIIGLYHWSKKQHWTTRHIEINLLKVAFSTLQLLTHTHTHFHTQRNKHTNIHTQTTKPTHTHKQTHAYKYTEKHASRSDELSYINRYASMHTWIWTCNHIHRNTWTQMQAFIYKLRDEYIHNYTCLQTHNVPVNTRTPKNTHAEIRIHTHANTIFT